MKPSRDKKFQAVKGLSNEFSLNNWITAIYMDEKNDGFFITVCIKDDSFIEIAMEVIPAEWEGFKVNIKSNESSE